MNESRILNTGLAIHGGGGEGEKEEEEEDVKCLDPPIPAISLLHRFNGG